MPIHVADAEARQGASPNAMMVKLLWLFSLSTLKLHRTVSFESPSKLSCKERIPGQLKERLYDLPKDHTLFEKYLVARSEEINVHNGPRLSRLCVVDPGSGAFDPVSCIGLPMLTLPSHHVYQSCGVYDP